MRPCEDVTVELQQPSCAPEVKPRPAGMPPQTVTPTSVAVRSPGAPWLRAASLPTAPAGLVCRLPGGQGPIWTRRHEGQEALPEEDPLGAQVQSQETGTV